MHGLLVLYISMTLCMYRTIQFYMYISSCLDCMKLEYETVEAYSMNVGNRVEWPY